MFQIQQFIDGRYRTIARKRSLSGAGLAAQTLTRPGMFRVLAPKGNLVILKGRKLASGNVRFVK